MANRIYLSKGTKIAIGVIAVVLVAILVVGILFGAYYFNRCLFGHDYGEDGICTRCGKEKLDEVQKEKDPESANDKEAAVNGGGMATVLPGNGIQLLAAKMPLSAAAPAAVTENTWTLTASVNESADDKYINWSVRWKDAQNAWAKGKTVTEYVTVTPTQAGALTATVKVLKDFGAQIEVVAMSRDNSSRSATCVFDYVQKITGITFNMPAINNDVTHFTFSIDTTAYTVASECKLSLKSDKLTFNLDWQDAFKTYFRQTLDKFQAYEFLHYVSPKLTLDQAQKTITQTRVECDQEHDGGASEQASGFTSYFICYPVAGWSGTCSLEDVQRSFKVACQSVPVIATFTVNYSATYGGKSYSDGSVDVDFKLDNSIIKVKVFDVTLDQTHIYA